MIRETTMHRQIRTLRHYGRQFAVLCCLVPASFVKYPHPGRWLAALRQGKTFFRDIMSESDLLQQQFRKRNPAIRILAGWPLRFAQQIRQHLGVVAALRWNLGKMLHKINISADGGEASRFSLRDPAPITLIDGLAERQPRALELAKEILSTLPTESASIEGHVVCHHGEDAFDGCISVVMAHWDTEGRVSAYVHHMGRHFHSLGWKVVLTSAAAIAEEDLPETLTWADAVVWRTCQGYDTTSWKAALHHFPSLYRSKELILNNDSVFGAIGSYAPMHDTMEDVACDFWGITESREMAPHLQSYHLVFRTAALAHPAFREFFDRVSLSNDRGTAIVFETRLALWLAMQGLRAGAYVPLPDAATGRINPVTDQWRAMIEAGVPLIKRELVMKNQRRADLSGWCHVLESKDYPLDLIFSYAWRQGLDLTPTILTGKRSGTWPPDVLALQQAVNLDSVSEQALAAVDCDETPLGVFVHIYYMDILPELLGYLANLPHASHVYVSTDTEDKAASIREQLAALFSTVEVRVLPNKGWDIGPFLVGFADVIPNYPLMVRVHAKASAQMAPEIPVKWRTLLYSSLLGSKDRVRRIRALFADQPGMGLICPPPLAEYATANLPGGNVPTMIDLLDQWNIDFRADTCFDFPMGAMFWCRPAVLKPWLDRNFTFDDFTPTDAGSRDGSLAHALERLFLFGCGLAKLHWGRIAPNSNRLAPASVAPTRTPPASLREWLKRQPLAVKAWHSFKKFRAEAARKRGPIVYTPLPEDDSLFTGVIVAEAQEKPDFALVLPRVAPRNFSGGPNTLLLFAAELAKHGHNVHCLSQTQPTCTTAELRSHLRDMLGLPADISARFRVSCLDAPVTLHRNDRLCASASWTVSTVQTLGASLDPAPFFYFIQDFEPLFYPWSEAHAKATLSYAPDCVPVINEPYLAEFFFRLEPGRFADPAFRESALVFMPAVDRQFFHPEPAPAKPTLLFYARPDAPRNLYYYGLEALYRLVREGRITPEWDVQCMGNDGIRPIDLGRKVITRTLPWLGFADYAARIRQASVGLSLMLSPHTSYMPLELAASGVPCVTTTYMNKNARLLTDLSPHLLGADPSPGAIADALRQAIDSPPPRKDRLKTPLTWAESFDPIMDKVLKYMK